MAEQNEDQLQEKISALVAELHNTDGLQRQQARHALIAIGQEAAPALIDLVANEKGHARWEAIEALGEIGDPYAANVLVDALLDDDTGIRWAASNALIGLDRAALEPLLVSLTKDFDSVWLRHGAHHILHVLKDRGRLYPKEIKVYEATQGVEPMVQVPWAAAAALEDLKNMG